jgi:hypothetical protein
MATSASSPDVHVVAAHYKEDTAWLDTLRYPHTVISRAGIPQETAPNRGNEVGVYLEWIVKNYDALPDYTVFIHAHQRSPHCAGDMAQIINQLVFDREYRNINVYPPIAAACFPAQLAILNPHKHVIEAAFGMSLPLEELRFNCCGQFYVSRAAIQRHPRQAYQAAYDWLMTTPLHSRDSGRLLEYTWHLLFTGNITDMIEPRTIAFYHGLGDCSNFAALLAPCIATYGDKVTVACDATKVALFEAFGIPTVTPESQEAAAALPHSWWEPPKDVPPADNVFFNNKNYRGIDAQPFALPVPRDEFWQRHAAQSAGRFKQYAPLVEDYLRDLPRPLVLLHSHGNTSASEKSMPGTLSRDFIVEFLRLSEGSVLVADWDSRTPWVHSGRVRNLRHHWPEDGFLLPSLMGLIHAVDLVVGVDSGPFHLAGVVNKPSIGVWFQHHPVHYSLPRTQCLNISFADTTSNIRGARAFNTVQAAETPNQARYLAQAAVAMLEYEPPCQLTRAEDVQLRLLTDKCFGGYVEYPGVLHAGNVVYDRSISFNYMFDHLFNGGPGKLIVETGCIRADNDWAGAGYSTFLFGLLAARTHGRVISFDITPEYVNYANDVCRPLGCVTVEQRDSVEGIAAIKEPINLLYLDSMDCYVPGYAEHGLREAQVGAGRVAHNGLIVFDDTLYEGSTCRGKGELGVPWLLKNGWKVVFAGHQVVLARA